jgi:RNA polymerase sigma factor (sigma-70 family)
LSAEETDRLIVKAQAGDKPAMDRLVSSNMKLVFRCAAKYQHSLPLEDLIQEGTIGLMKAISRFDTKRKLRLSTYAYLWITVMCRKASQVNGVVSAYVGNKSYRTLKTMPQVSITEPLHSSGPDDPETLEGKLADQGELQDQKFDRAETSRVVRTRLHVLFPNTAHGARRRRDILNRLYHYEPAESMDPDYTLGAIGDRHDVSRERIRQLEVQIRRKIHKDPVFQKMVAK